MDGRMDGRMDGELHVKWGKRATLFHQTGGGTCRSGGCSGGRRDSGGCRGLPAHCQTHTDTHIYAHRAKDHCFSTGFANTVSKLCNAQK